MARVRIQDLKSGDEVYCWMRLGLAVTRGQRGNTTVYGKIPGKPQKAADWDLTRFAGFVMQNNIADEVLTMRITDTNSQQKVQNRFEPVVVDVHYSAFSRVRLLSKINFEPNPKNNTFPANFPDAAFKPYRTLTEVVIPHYY